MFKILVYIFAFIGFVTVVVGAGMYFSVSSLFTQLVGDSKALTASLEEKYKVEVTIKKEKKCDFGSKLENDVRKLDNYLGSMSCVGNKACVFSAKLEKRFEDYYIKAKNRQGVCSAVKIPAAKTKSHKVYSGTVKLGSDYLKSKGITVEGKKLGEVFTQKKTMNGEIGGQMSFGGNYTINISYDTKPTSDVITVSGKKIEISY